MHGRLTHHTVFRPTSYQQLILVWPNWVLSISFAIFPWSQADLRSSALSAESADTKVGGNVLGFCQHLHTVDPGFGRSTGTR